MSKKNIKIHYYYPLIKNENKIVNLSPLLIELKTLSPEERVLEQGEENIQLKDIEYFENNKRWRLGFLRNQIDAPFKTKLNDNKKSAESLDDDEFIGQECCCIYDEETYVIALQNNKNSVSFNRITSFFNQYYINKKIYLSPLTYQEKYNEINLDDNIEYRSLIIGYTNIDKIVQIDEDAQDKKIIGTLQELSNNMESINGKIELSVGHKKSFLKKIELKKVVELFKKNPTVTKTLKVKMVDEDTIRLIDLLNNTLRDEGEISVTKDDPKNFQKIFNVMDSLFDVAKEELFDKCIKFTED